MRSRIVEKDKTEERMHESQTMLQNVEQIAHIGTWKLNHSTGEMQCSDELYRILGIKPKDDYSTFFEDGINAIHPDDRERAIHISKTALGLPDT